MKDQEFLRALVRQLFVMPAAAAPLGKGGETV